MITARPRQGAEGEWERTAHATTRVAAGFSGHLGTTVLRPPPDSDGDYHIIVKFDTAEHLDGWRRSPERAEWVARLQALEAVPRSDKAVSGLETWFEPSNGIGPPAPPKWKMAIVVWIAVYAAVLPLLAYLRPWLSGLPAPVGAAVGAAASVAMMTWLVMPFLGWLLRNWLYPTRRRTPDAAAQGSGPLSGE